MKSVKFLGLLITVVICGIILVSCDKDKSLKDFDPTSIQQLAQDEVSIENYTNEAMDDANEVLSKGNLKSTSSLPCNANIDSLISGDTLIYTITFNGLNCNGNKYKTGQIKFKKSTSSSWAQAGSTVTLEFINFKVVKTANPLKWIKLNGTKLWTNVSGGLIKNLGNGTTSVVHTITGSLQTTFSDSTCRTWNVARKKTFTGSYPSALILSIEGIGNSNGYANLATWGSNRQNENFYTQINQAIVLKQSCNWDPVSGIKVHQIPSDNKSATVTFGYDLNNQIITNGNCPDRYKVDWAKNGLSGTTYLDLH